MGDWAITTYWGTGTPPNPRGGRFGVDRGVASVRAGWAADGLWQLDILRKYAAHVLNGPYLLGVAGMYDELWSAGCDPGWNYLLASDAEAAAGLRALPGGTYVELDGGRAVYCLPDVIPALRARATYRLGDGAAGVEAALGGALALNGTDLTYVVGRWTAEHGPVGIGTLTIEPREWDWTVTRVLSGAQNELAVARFTDIRYHSYWPDPVDRPRASWPYRATG